MVAEQVRERRKLGAVFTGMLFLNFEADVGIGVERSQGNIRFGVGSTGAVLGRYRHVVVRATLGRCIGSSKNWG